ncbi:MAG: sensor histidine kinase [Gammaproteobacteria bacterium]
MTTEPPHASFLPDFCGTRSVFVVIVVGELLAIILTLAQPPQVTDRLFELALYSLFIQWIALTCVATLCLSRSYLNHLQDHWVATLSYAITLVVSLVITEIAWWLFIQWPAWEEYSRYDHGLFLGRSMSISAIVCALALRYFYVQQQWRRRIKSESEANFQALQSRIRPHFLFNCLNTIASLTRRQPALAEQAIEDLADLFRISLHDARQSTTLHDEVELCKRYLRIEKHRLGERLTVEWQIDALPGDITFPPLSLQPLLENAIYHGIELLPQGGTIRIAGAVGTKSLTITIENPLPETHPKTGEQAGNRLAQENIGRRLSALYRQTGLLKITTDERNYRVTITIPLNHENTDRR